MRLVRPDPPLSNGNLVLTALTEADAEEIATDCDFKGWVKVDAILQDESSVIEECQRLGLWVIVRAALWTKCLRTAHPTCPGLFRRPRSRALRSARRSRWVQSAIWRGMDQSRERLLLCTMHTTRPRDSFASGGARPAMCTRDIRGAGGIHQCDVT